MSCGNSYTGCEEDEAGTSVPALQVAVIEAETSDLPRVTLWETQWAGILGIKQSRCGEWPVLYRGQARCHNLVWCFILDHTQIRSTIVCFLFRKDDNNFLL